MRRHFHNCRPEQPRRLGVYVEQQPVVQRIYEFKQNLMALLLLKQRTRRQCAALAPQLLSAIRQLQESGLAHLVTLGGTPQSWIEEIGRMRRFSRNNGITEGFHNKMETISRQAFGFRNFQNYRMRVKVLCG